MRTETIKCPVCEGRGLSGEWHHSVVGYLPCKKCEGTGDGRNERTTREGITVEAGQVWRDLDKRCGGRTRTVIEVKDGKALMDGRKRVRVAVRRMHRHSTGWSLVCSVRSAS